jgi:hypothetical protein
MEAATIVGVYDFIGYRLCQYMLDMGIAITGVHFEKHQENENMEEKRLEIGRNANFQELSFRDWDAENVKGVLFISLLEKLQSSQEEMINQKLMKKLDQITNGNLQIILILPGYLAEKNQLQHALSEYLTRRNFTVLEFYLPTVYGPWQPDYYFFQQCIDYSLNGNLIPVLAEWEWNNDAIYIDDGVSLILESVEGRAQGKYFMTSGKSDQWFDCAELLLDGRFEATWRKPQIKPKIHNYIEILTLKNNEEISSGLSRQKKQFCRIRENSLNLFTINDFAKLDSSE